MSTAIRPHSRISWRILAAMACAILLFASAALPGYADEGSAPKPKNVIIMVADGAGGTQWELGRYSSERLRGQSFVTTEVMFDQGTLGLMSNYPEGAIVTDSAAAATAMSTGEKTTNGTLSMTADGQPILTLMEAAKASGKRIGLVTTDEVWDATPAAFSIHSSGRRDPAPGLVDRYLALEPDLLMGGGAADFLPRGEARGTRDDGQDVIASFRDAGYEAVATLDELRDASSPKLLGLFALGKMQLEIDRRSDERPSMADMTEAAIRVLSENSPNGFVLLLENGNVDFAGHRNDAGALLRELWTFDDAVGIALEFQRRSPGETLLVVTGDHETGGLSVTYGQRDWSTTDSSNRFYPSDEHLEKAAGIDISMEEASRILGKQPAPEAVDRLLAEHFQGFTLEPDLREAILKGKMLDINYTYPVQQALGRMVARQTGFFFGSGAHTTEPVVIGAMGPGAERFGGYLDNAAFGKRLLALVVAE